MDRLFDAFDHIAEIGIAGLTIAGAPSGRWSSSEARNASIATSTSKSIRARPSSSRTSMRAFRISERQFERYKALSILMEPLSPRSANPLNRPARAALLRSAGWIDHHDPAASASSCR
jgi:hypothetical protein